MKNLILLILITFLGLQQTNLFAQVNVEADGIGVSTAVESGVGLKINNKDIKLRGNNNSILFDNGSGQQQAFIQFIQNSTNNHDLKFYNQSTVGDIEFYTGSSNQLRLILQSNGTIRADNQFWVRHQSTSSSPNLRLEQFSGSDTYSRIWFTNSTYPNTIWSQVAGTTENGGDMDFRYNDGGGNGTASIFQMLYQEKKAQLLAKGTLAVNMDTPAEEALHVDGNGRFDGGLIDINRSNTGRVNFNTTNGATTDGWVGNEFGSGAVLKAERNLLKIENDETGTLGDILILGTGGFIRLEESGNLGIGDVADIASFQGASINYKLEVDGSAGKPGGGSWTNSSDRRLKQNIRDYKDGLEKLLKIRPVWYQYNELSGHDTNETYVGIIAQEMKEIAPYTIGSFEQNGKQYYDYNESAIKYMMINAIQELNDKVAKEEKKVSERDAQLEEQQTQINALEERLANLEKLLISNNSNSLNIPLHSTDVLVSGATTPQLAQNVPNPFEEQTQIKYYLPEDTQSALLTIQTQNGQILKTIPLTDNGEGIINLSMKDLPTGSYSYSLRANGQLIATKQMILTK